MNLKPRPEFIYQYLVSDKKVIKYNICLDWKNILILVWFFFFCDVGNGECPAGCGRSCFCQEKSIGLVPFAVLLVLTGRDSPKLHSMVFPGQEFLCWEKLRAPSGLISLWWPRSWDLDLWSGGKNGPGGTGTGHLLSLFSFLALIAWHHPALHLTFAFEENYTIWGEKHLFYTSRWE